MKTDLWVRIRALPVLAGLAVIPAACSGHGASRTSGSGDAAGTTAGGGEAGGTTADDDEAGGTRAGDGASAGATADDGGSGGTSAGGGGSGGTTAGGGEAGGTTAGGGASTSCGINLWSSGDTKVTFTVDGLVREYTLHVPAAYTGVERVPLVVDMHGYAGSAKVQQERSGGWQAKADAAGFIIVYPTGSPIPGGGAQWAVGDGDLVDDVAFVRTLVAKLESEGCIDAGRIYATGVSNGGAMAHRLGCAAADLFAAIAPVDADIVGQSCNPSRSIPVVFFRAMGDGVYPYEGSEEVPGALASFEEWKTHDACKAGPAGINDYCSGYSGCDGGSEVILCSLAADPGGAVLNHGGSYAYPFANGFKLVDFAWMFLERFRLP